MPIKRKRCRFCHDWFTCNPRTEHQICCEKPECREQRKIAAKKLWWSNNPDYDKSRAGKKLKWARRRDYWRYYRRTHPAYAAADNKRRRKAYKARYVDSFPPIISLRRAFHEAERIFHPTLHIISGLYT